MGDEHVNRPQLPFQLLHPPSRHPFNHPLTATLQNRLIRFQFLKLLPLFCAPPLVDLPNVATVLLFRSRRRLQHLRLRRPRRTTSRPNRFPSPFRRNRCELTMSYPFPALTLSCPISHARVSGVRKLMSTSLRSLSATITILMTRTCLRRLQSL